MRIKEMQLNILGSTWKVVSRKEKDDERLKNASGLTDPSCRMIVLADATPEEYTIGVPANDLQRTLRHEIVHAFLYESGLWCNSGYCENWAMHEEIVDWISLQLPKIWEVCSLAGAMPGQSIALDEDR